ncbi:hypothetical protein K7574_21155 (plasmid) [Stenotrophomonas maltophilia]|uniref:hypothetical protein n=1 Tax=Stenotrophomonas maltophilia TaxID=40324 RepID=UPI001D0C02AB|nr:hypothetical protein [Stenotrophomonas maltophilia]UXF74718.1 hypothetical protein K7574_21155 [Stenotrophomonas maltophilia]
MSGAGGMAGLWHTWGDFAPWVALVAAVFAGAQLRHRNWRTSSVAAFLIAAALVLAPFLFTTPLAVLLATQAGLLALGRRAEPLWARLGPTGRARLWRCPALSVASAVLLFGVGLYFTRYPINVDEARIYMPSELIRVAIGAGCSLAGFVLLLFAFWLAVRVVWSVTFGRPELQPER